MILNAFITEMCSFKNSNIILKTFKTVVARDVQIMWHQYVSAIFLRIDIDKNQLIQTDSLDVTYLCKQLYLTKICTQNWFSQHNFIAYHYQAIAFLLQSSLY